MTPVGRILKTHGHRGETVVELDRPWPEGLQWVFVDIDGIPVPWHVDAVRPRGHGSLLLTLRGIDTLEDAASLAGKQLTADVPEDEEGDDGQVYVSDLVGYSLRDGDGAEVGTVEDWDDSTANVLLRVRRHDGSLVDVPLADELVTDLDTDARAVTLDLPRGLF